MSVDGDSSSHAAFDSTDHQPAYVFTPSTSLKTRSGTKPPTKRRKLGQSSGADEPKSTKPVRFTPLLNNTESDACVRFRQDLFQTSWDFTAEQIQSVLSEANEDTLAGVTSFVQDPVSIKTADCTPTGFIVTGPNIASQALLFHQLSERLRENITGPVITLRSGDASNLKAALKKIIRDATNQKPSDDEDEDGISLVQDGRKLLYYDLEILHSYVKIHGCERAVVAFQDSEAFDSSLLTDLITLFASWLDRIPFVLLFGIATSVELFHERLPRTATRSLSGSQFDVAQTSSILEKLFQKAIGSSHAPIRLGPSLISSFLERQFDHVQSVQAFLAAIKYSYMCHFYANPLTILLEVMRHPEQIRKLLQPQHYEAIRNLPSFKKLIEGLLDEHDLTRVRDLLEDDTILLEEVKKALEYRDIGVVKVLRAAHILSSNEPGQALSIDLYIKAFDGTLDSSDAARSVLGSVKYMGPDELGKFLENTLQEIDNGCDILDLDGWAGKDNLYKMIRDIYSEVSSLIADVSETDTPIRSKYSAHKKVMRTTIVAQKVQLSHDVSKLTRKDDEFTTLIDRVVHLLGDCFTVPTPHDLFMNEIWLYDFKSPYKDVFTPKPRFALERALSMPHDYLGNGASEDSLSSSQPATAILYQLYLETGSFINIFDLWSAFYAIVGGEDGEGMGERDALVLFYRALAELKLLGMVKQSKRKSDHLAKLAWKGM